MGLVESTQVLPLITTFHPSTVEASKILKENLNKSSLPQDILPDRRVIAAHRRNPNLKNLLVRTKLPALNPLNRPDPHPHFLQKRVLKHDGHTIKTPSNGSPQDQNLVYLISCNHCGIRYVGETCRPDWHNTFVISPWA